MLHVYRHVSVMWLPAHQPQDPHIEEFTNRFYELHNMLGTELQEKQLGYSMTQLQVYTDSQLYTVQPFFNKDTPEIKDISLLLTPFLSFLSIIL